MRQEIDVVVPGVQGTDLQVALQGGPLRSLPARTASPAAPAAPAPAVDAQVLHTLVDALVARA